MKKIYLWGLGLIFILIFAWPATAGDDKVSSDFDDVEVVYAAQFTAVPVTTNENSWAAELAGGPKEPLTVLYGVVNLKRANVSITTQEFLKVSGPTGAERLLGNAYTTKWYNQEEGKYNRLAGSRTLFWSAIPVSDNLLDKNVDGWNRAVTFQREFDENGNLIDVKLFFTDDGRKGRDLFWDWARELQGNLFQADINTLENVGEPTSTK